MTKPKVLFDARWIIVGNRHDGVSRYSTELAKALAARGDIDVAWLVYDEKQLAKLPERPHVIANNPSQLLKESFTLAHIVNKSGYRLLYSPFFTVGTLGKKFKLVLTIHDLIYYKHRTPPQWLPLHIRVGWWLYHTSYWPMRWQLNRADIVATVSNAAMQELQNVKATKRKIICVPNAVSNDFLDKIPRDHYNQNNVVFMGAFTPYKNVECIIDALKYLPEVTLHLCGKLPAARRPKIEKYIADRNVTHRVVLYDGATDDQYKEALRHARCAVSASRMEGFGLPLIEAQQAGVPFAAANTTIFHEIGQDSVLFFDPNNPKECAERIKSFANKKISQDYIARGRKNIERFSWDKSAATAAAVCHSLIGIGRSRKTN